MSLSPVGIGSFLSNFMQYGTPEVADAPQEVSDRGGRSRDVRPMARQLGYMAHESGTQSSSMSMTEGRDSLLLSPDSLLSGAMDTMQAGEADLDFVGDEMLDAIQDLYRRAEAVEGGRASEEMLDSALSSATTEIAGLLHEVGFEDKDAAAFAQQTVGAVMMASETGSGQFDLNFDVATGGSQKIAGSQSYSYQQIDTQQGSWYQEQSTFAEQFLSTLEMTSVDISIDLNDNSIDVDLSRSNAADVTTRITSSMREGYQQAQVAGQTPETQGEPSVTGDLVPQQERTQPESDEERFVQFKMQMLSMATQAGGRGGRPGHAGGPPPGGGPHGKPPAGGPPPTDETDETEETMQTTEDLLEEILDEIMEEAVEGADSTDDATATELAGVQSEVQSVGNDQETDEQEADEQAQLDGVDPAVTEEPVDEEPVSTDIVAAEAAAEEPTDPGLAGFFGRLQGLAEQLGADRTMGGVFSSLFEVTNISYEQNDGANMLRFSLNATFAVGLTTVNPNGQSETLYQRTDGTLVNAVSETMDMQA